MGVGNLKAKLGKLLRLLPRRCGGCAGRNSQLTQPLARLQCLVTPGITLDDMTKLGNSVVLLSQFN